MNKDLKEFIVRVAEGVLAFLVIVGLGTLYLVLAIEGIERCNGIC